MKRWTVAFVMTLLIGGCTMTPHREIQTEIVIDSPPADVWQVLTNGAEYSQWNPFITSMKGEIVVGERIENSMEATPGKPVTFRPRILVADENRELRWLGSLFVPRIFDGEHYFILEAHARGTRVVHGEKFRGVALWFMDVDRFADNFSSMNEALKVRVEQ
jgi:hypothetical protein